MTDGTDFAAGEKVRLLRLDTAFFSGLDEKDAMRLKGLVGQVWTVETQIPHGLIELVFVHSAGEVTPLEWVCVPCSWIERV